MRAALIGAVIVGTLVAGTHAPAVADVKAGVDAWQQGDYARAVAQWRPLAEAGDADAQFNMGQAYKLGRGVTMSLPAAIEWFAKAAAQRHQRAEDNYGLLLFQQGQRAEAMPTIRKSAERGEPRAQYILGTAMFNGDLVQKDWVMAYALMTRAASAGLEQATASLESMDKYIPADQRQKGLALATRMAKTSGVQVAAAPNAPSSAPPAGTRRIAGVAVPPSTAAPKSEPARVPPPVRSVPPKATLPERVATASPTATAPPPPPKVVARTAPPPSPVPAPVPKPAPRVATATATAAPSSSGGPWRIQLGAFREEPRARALWTQLQSNVADLAAYQPYLVRDGGITRLQAGGLRTEADASRLCGRIKAKGYDCLTRRL